MKPENRVRNIRYLRGAAIVEFSILLVAFIPLIMLPMYFADAMRYKLDLQEAVCSTAWDFAYADYTKNNAFTATRDSMLAANKNLYSNLWSGKKVIKDANQSAGPFADFAWVEELNCDLTKNFANKFFSDNMLLARKFKDKFAKNSGLVSCHGRISVSNRHIPKEYLQDKALHKGFAKVELFSLGTAALQLPRVSFGIMVDPWTIHNPANVKKRGEGNKDFFDRAQWMFKGGSDFGGIFYNLFRFAYLGFGAMLAAEEISLTAMIFDYPADMRMWVKHPVTEKIELPKDPLAFNPFQGGSDKSPTDYFVTPMKDTKDGGKKGDFEDTYNNRGYYYMGCKEWSNGDDCPK